MIASVKPLTRHCSALRATCFLGYICAYFDCAGSDASCEDWKWGHANDSNKVQKCMHKCSVHPCDKKTTTHIHDGITLHSVGVFILWQ